MDSPRGSSGRVDGGPAEAVVQIARWLTQKLLWVVQSAAFIAAGSAIVLVPMTFRFHREREAAERLLAVENTYDAMMQPLNLINGQNYVAYTLFLYGNTDGALQALDSATSIWDREPLCTCDSSCAGGQVPPAPELTGDGERVVKLLCANRTVLRGHLDLLGEMIESRPPQESVAQAWDSIAGSYDDTRAVIDTLMIRVRGEGSD